MITLFKGEMSMDNPPLLSGEPLLSAGNSFVFKGEYCTVQSTYPSGFWYEKQSGGTAYMNWWFYRTIPSYKAKKGIMVGVQRKIIRKQLIMRAIETILS